MHLSPLRLAPVLLLLLLLSFVLGQTFEPPEDSDDDPRPSVPASSDDTSITNPSISVSSANSAVSTECKPCRRVNLVDGSPADSTPCLSCLGSELLCDPSSELLRTCDNFRVVYGTYSGRYYRREESIAAQCKDARGQTKEIQIGVNNLMQNLYGPAVMIAGVTYNSTCTTSELYNNASVGVYCNSNSRFGNNWWYTYTETLDLNALYANVDGKAVFLGSAAIPLGSGFVGVSPSTDVCRKKPCEEGFQPVSQGSTVQCIRCNNATMVPPGWFCDGSHTTPQKCPPGYACPGSDQPRQPCEAGCECSGGASTCTGECSAGQICRRGTVPDICPQDYYCPAGLKTEPLPCDSNCMCAAGSSAACPYTCRPGSLCVDASFDQFCPIGYYCRSNVMTECPAGTWADEFGLSDESCSGSCGTMWTSEAGSLGCYEMSNAAIAIVTISVIAIIVVIMSVTAYFGSCATKRKCFVTPAENIDSSDIEKEVRSMIQKQIQTGVAALAARVVTQSIPSVLTLSNSLLQFNRATTAEQVAIEIKLARMELTNHIIGILLQHSRLKFDDETYPYHLPLWAEVDPNSEDGQLELVKASNTISLTIRTAVENDILDWFRRQHGEEPMYEESREGLLSGDSSTSNIASHWPAVDSELRIALRTALPDPSWCKCLSGFRTAYSRFTMRSVIEASLWSFLRVACDILVLVACFLSILDNPLIKLEVPFDGSNAQALASLNYYYRYNFNFFRYRPFAVTLDWNSVHKAHFCSFYSNFDTECDFAYFRSRPSTSGVNLFQPIIDECTGIYGRTYRNLLIFTCVCFWIVIIISFLKFCDAFLQFTRYGRGFNFVLSQAEAAIKKFIRSIGSKAVRNRAATWFLENGILHTIRLLGVLGMIASVTTYSTGCIARLNRAPAVVQANFPPDGSSQFHDYRALDLSAVAMTRVVYSVTMQDVFILTIVTTVLAMIHAALVLQQAYQKARESCGASNESANPQQQPFEAESHSLEMHEIHPATSSSVILGIESSVHVPALDDDEKEHAVTFHTQGEASGTASVAVVSEEPSDEALQSEDRGDENGVKAASPSAESQ